MVIFNLTSSIEHVASAYYCLYSSFFFLEFVEFVEQYLALEMQLERKLGNSNTCILSKDRYAAYRGTNLPSSLFDCRANMK